MDVCLWLTTVPPFSQLASPWVPLVPLAQLPCDAAADRLGRSQRLLGAYVMMDPSLQLRGRLPILGFHSFYSNSHFTGKTPWSFISDTSVRDSRATQSLIKAGGLYHCLPSCSQEATSITLRTQWWQRAQTQPMLLK